MPSLREHRTAARHLRAVPATHTAARDEPPTDENLDQQVDGLLRWLGLQPDAAA